MAKMKEKYKNRRMYFLTFKSKVISKPTGKLFKMGEKVGRKREKKEKKEEERKKNTGIVGKKMEMESKKMLFWEAYQLNSS